VLKEAMEVLEQRCETVEKENRTLKTSLKSTIPGTITSKPTLGANLRRTSSFAVGGATSQGGSSIDINFDSNPAIFQTIETQKKIIERLQSLATSRLTRSLKPLSFPLAAKLVDKSKEPSDEMKTCEMGDYKATSMAVNASRVYRLVSR
jgi:hypothetical protein